MAALAGYLLGAAALLPVRSSEASTPLSRVGFALRERSTGAGPEDFALLAEDIEQVRSNLKPELRGIFDLVFAVRGLTREGAPDLSRAEELCRAAKWRRCDRASLEELGRRSTP